MVTIQAPGIEINEIDLSQYDTSGQKEQTTNVYVTGFASKGLNYSPYKFTYHDTESDLLKIFGTPTNEAERYFMHACKEVISQDKAVLYASRLPYCNKALSTINCAEWELSTVQSISMDYQYWLGFIEGEATLEDVSKDENSKPISVCVRLDNKKSYFNTDFEKIEKLSVDDTETTIAQVVTNHISDYIDMTKTGVSADTSYTITVLSGYDNLSATQLSHLNNNSEDGCVYEFKLLSPITINSGSLSGTVVTPCYYRMPYGGRWGNKFGEIYTEDKTMQTAADIKFIGPEQKTLEQIDLYRTGERKPATNRFMIVDKTQAQYDEVPVDKFHKGNNQQVVGIVPVITTAANALYVQKMIDVDEDDIDQLKNYEALGNIHTMVEDADVVDISSVVGGWQNTVDMFGSEDELNENRVSNPYIYAENILNSETGDIEPKIYNNILVTPTNSQFLSPDNKNATTMGKIASKLFPFIGKTDTGDYDREYLKHIGVVVFMGIKDPEEGNKVNFKVVESFAGSLKPTATNSTTGESMFIDDIVNTNSKYIEFYSNCFNGDDNNFYTWDNDHQNESEYEQQQPGTDNEQANPCESIVFRSIMPGNTGTVVTGSGTESSTVYEEEAINEIVPSTYNKKNNDYNSLKDVEDPTNKGTYARPGQKNGIIYNDVDILVANRLDTVCFGFKKYECLKIINVTESISKALDKCFEKMKDVNARQIDLVCDAGVSNIAQFYTTCNCPKGIFFMDEEDPDRGWYSVLETNENGYNGNMNRYKVALNYNPVSPHAVKYWQLSDVAHTEKWKMILRKYDNFCKNVRKDCMFIADGLRPLCVKGNAKLVRKSNFNATIGNSISPRVKYMSGAIDTSYGAGYCDWMQIDDRYTGLPMWLPPSIKMVGVYIRSTNNGHYWDAPAGVNRGRLDVRDIAFSPTVDEAAAFYTKNWNYCTYYEDEGNVVEGQKTFQSKPTAFDRVNVRRLFLGLERRVFLAGKYFLYEGNTAYTRQRLIDTITPWFEDAKVKGGCYDYRIQCDELNNTADTIDRNELHIRIGIKPVKAIEFIDATFVCLRTGGSWTEAGF